MVNMANSMDRGQTRPTTTPRNIKEKNTFKYPQYRMQKLY